MVVIKTLGGNVITQGVGTNRLKREKKNYAEAIALGPAGVWDVLATLYRI